MPDDNTTLINPRLLSGFRDFLPRQKMQRDWLIEVVRRVYESFGFLPLETPVLEYSDILTGKYGEEANMMMYRFRDQGDRDVAMRYDLTVPFARVIAIQEEDEDEPQVLPYEKVYQLIESAKVLGLAHCACRTAFSNCDAPLEACMLFDDTCTYLVERGFARYISRDEMKTLLREFDEKGLVHNVNNSQDKLQFICNCCPCCCGFLRGVLELDVPNWLATSGFLARVDEELCSGCAVCEDRCPMGAIEVVDEVPVINNDRCIGCALCVTGCETGAMRLKRREEAPEVPESMRQMGVEALKRRGRLEDFLEAIR